MTELEKIYITELEEAFDELMDAVSVILTGNYPRESTEGTMNKALDLCEHGRSYEDDCIDCLKQHLEELIR